MLGHERILLNAALYDEAAGGTVPGIKREQIYQTDTMASEQYQLFSSLLKQRRYQEAIDLAERESMTAGGAEFWATQLSRACLLSGRTRQALEAAQRALQSSPNNAYALLARAEAAARLGNDDQASADYAELVRHERVGDRARRGLLHCMHRQKRWDAMLTAVAEWGLKESESLPWRARALAGAGRRDEAIEACRAWLRDSPDDPHALWQLTEFEIERDGLEAVMKRIGRLARIPGKPSVYGEIYASLSKRSGDSAAAIGQYEKLSKRQSDPRILRKQAFALAKAGREPEAVALMEELLRTSPRDVYLHSSYSAACRRINEVERARRFYLELLALHPEVKTLFGYLRRLERRREKQ